MATSAPTLTGAQTFANATFAQNQNTGADTFAKATRGSPAPTNTTFNPVTSNGGPSPVAVVTSGPATSNFNAISQDYQQNIKPTMQNAQSNAQAQNQLPVISGYNVSANPTGNLGEKPAINQATGLKYYITPQNQAPTANDIKSILSGGTDTGTPPASNNAPTGTQSATQTPVQQAQAQTGIDPTAENQNFQGQVQGVTDEISNAYKSFQSTVNSIMSGSFPLTSAQKSLVDATNQAFEQMNTQSNLKAAALSSETGGVSDKVNATAGELMNITSQQSAAIAKLEIGFQDKNYQMVTDSYKEFKDLEKAKMDSITSLHNTVLDTYNKALAADQAQQTFNQTQFKDATTLAQNKYEFRDMKDAFGNTIGTQVFDKATGSPVASHYVAGQTDPNTGVTTPIVTTDPNTGTVDKTAQEQYLQTVPAPFRSLVVGIANGKIEPPSARTAKGAQILSMVANYDPTLSDGSGGFDATKYQARLTMQKSLASYTAGSYGQGVLSANKVVSHLASFLNSSSAIPGKGAVNLFGSNKPAAELAGGISALFGSTKGQSVQAQAEQESRGLTDEMTKFFKGTGGTDVESIKSWSKGLDPYASSGTLNGTIQGTLDLYSGQLNSFIQQYKTVMGQDPSLGTILQSQTVQTLSAFKNAGYKIDLPGVYYTDKNAYLSNGGSEQSLTSAYSTLQSKEIPTTPENILQAAQILNQ